MTIIAARRADGGSRGCRGSSADALTRSFRRKPNGQHLPRNFAWSDEPIIWGMSDQQREIRIMNRRTVFTMSLAGAASAADMSLGATYTRVPYVSPIYNWTGFHITMKVCLIFGLFLLATGQAWSAGAPSAPQIKQASLNGVTLAYQEQ